MSVSTELNCNMGVGLRQGGAVTTLLHILYELDRQSQPNRRGCHCWKLWNQPFAFCGQFGTAFILWMGLSTCIESVFWCVRPRSIARFLDLGAKCIFRVERYLKYVKQFILEICSCEIRRTQNAEPLLWIERSHQRWFSHVTSMPQERFAKQVLLATLTGKLPRGRPRTRWHDYISDLA